jgi:hypothetical protein
MAAQTATNSIGWNRVQGQVSGHVNSSDFSVLLLNSDLRSA